MSVSIYLFITCQVTFKVVELTLVTLTNRGLPTGTKEEMKNYFTVTITLK